MGVLEPIARLAAQFSRMPGIGSKSALRLAYFVVDQPEAEVKALAFALVDAKERVHNRRALRRLRKSEKEQRDPLRRLRPEGYSRP